MGKLMTKTDELMLQEPSAAYRSFVPAPSNPTTAERGLGQKNQVLNTALDTVQAARLRSIIKNLCLISDSAEKHISQLLLTPEGNVNATSKRKRSAADENIEASNGNKRMKPRYAMCTQCDSEFDVTLNHGRACRYHPGNREADYAAEIWADLDENCHGRISDLEDEFPEGFGWTCCERAGDREGCKRGPHREEVMEADEESDENVTSDTDLEDGEDSNNSEDGGE